MIFLCVKQYKTQIQNTQIQHIMKCQKHPTYGIFLKRGLFKDITNDIPICQTGKYKNASTQIHKYRAYNKMTEKTCGIFLKQLYNSSNMINAESAQFTRSSFKRPCHSHFVCLSENLDLAKYSVWDSKSKRNRLSLSLS